MEITSWSKLNRKQLESYLKLVRESFGDELGIYTSQYMWDSSIGAPVLGSYKLWVANHQVERPNLPKKGLWEDWWLWQFTNKGRLERVGVNLDLSYFNGTQDEFEEWTGKEIKETNILRIERLERALEKLCVKMGIDPETILN